MAWAAMQDSERPSGQGCPAPIFSVLTIPWHRGTPRQGRVRPTDPSLTES